MLNWNIFFLKWEFFFCAEKKCINFCCKTSPLSQKSSNSQQPVAPTRKKSIRFEHNQTPIWKRREDDEEENKTRKTSSRWKKHELLNSRAASKKREAPKSNKWNVLKYIWSFLARERERKEDKNISLKNATGEQTYVTRATPFERDEIETHLIIIFSVCHRWVVRIWKYF